MSHSKAPDQGVAPLSGEPLTAEEIAKLQTRFHEWLAANPHFGATEPAKLVPRVFAMAGQLLLLRERIEAILARERLLGKSWRRATADALLDELRGLLDAKGPTDG